MKLVLWISRALALVCAANISCTGHISEPGGPPPIGPCVTTSTPATLALLNSGKRNGEFSLAYDPRTTAAQGGQTLVYAAGQEVTLDATNSFPSCIIAKKTVVFVSDQGGMKGSWKVAPGNSDLPGAGNPNAAFPRARLPQSQVWATDEVIRVASDGTVYLTILDLSSYTSCIGQPNLDQTTFDEVEIFASPPGATSFQGLVVAADNERTGSRPTGPIDLFDLPQLAVNPSDPAQAVVFYTVAFANPRSELRTIHRAANGALSVTTRQTNLVAQDSNIAFDTQQHLYAVTPGLTVTQFSFAAGWNAIRQGGPTASPFSTPFKAGIPLDAGQTFGVFSDPTPAMAVGTIQGDSEPTVFLSVDAMNPAGDQAFPTVQIFASKVSEMGTAAGWGSALPFPAPTNTVSLFHSAIALNTTSNVLDVVALQTSPAATPAQTPINTLWTRFDPARLRTVAPLPAKIVSPNPPLASDLPRREPQFAALFPNTLFVGEYLGLDVRGDIAMIAHPERDTPTVTSMAVSFITPVCDTAQQSSSALVDDAWECTCACQNLRTNASTSLKVQGCAPAGATGASACAAVCPGRADGTAPFSDAIACAGSGFPTTARRLTLQACRVSDGSRPGGLVTDAADVIASSGSAASVALHKGTDTFQTALSGTVSLNLGGTPRAGTAFEFARLDLVPQTFFGTVGGVPTSVHDFALSHRGRLRGVFTDATHFALSPAAGQLDLSFVISQGCIDPCPDEIVTVHKTNFQPITGALDLVAKTISFNVNESAGSDGVSINFGGAVTAVPPDTDHDGVFDGADNCPLVSNPTQQRVASPKLTAPPGLNVTTCSGVALGTPTVTDICGAGGVVVSNNAPAVFPLGKTVVTWTARDARGNAATATQTVTATLGDSATCCPSGTHVIMGTAGADRIDGTEGADCILGLGGDDRIDGRGGSDFISGGAGRDTIQGGFGNDVITGGDGDDTINAGPDDDTIDGGPGTDTCDGSSGHNTVIACEVIAGG